MADRSEPILEYVPKRHVCSFLARHASGRWWYTSVLEGVSRYPVGTVRRCDGCGATWVAGEAPGHVPNIWRREGRVERWLRRHRL